MKLKLNAQKKIDPGSSDQLVASTSTHTNHYKKLKLKVISKKPSINLIHGDCLERMKEIPDNSVDCVITDPPYGTTQCKWDSVIPFVPMWEQLKRIIKDNGAICLFGSEPFSSALRMSNIKMFKYDWIWEKDRPSNPLLSKYQPMKYHELIHIFCQKGVTFYPIKTPSNDKRVRTKTYETKREVNSSSKSFVGKEHNPKLKNPKAIQYFARNWRPQDQLHPTQKPVALLEYLIKTYTLENETVLDFTMGSSSTGVACVNLNRKFIGIEKDNDYFNIGVNRIKERLKCLNLKIEPMIDMEGL